VRIRDERAREFAIDTELEPVSTLGLIFEVAIMARSRLKYAALLMLVLCGCVAQAEKPTVRQHSCDLACSSTLTTTQFLNAPAVTRHVPARLVSVALAYTLPPEDKPKTHWPWWLRILAAIFLLVFIRIVAGSVRNKPTGPPPV
jgi:hypothetical protein